MQPRLTWNTNTINNAVEDSRSNTWKVWKDIGKYVKAWMLYGNFFHMIERTHVPRHAFANIYSHRFLNVSQPWPGPWSGQPLPPSSPPPSRHSEPDYCKLNMWTDPENCELDAVRLQTVSWTQWGSCRHTSFPPKMLYYPPTVTMAKYAGTQQYSINFFPSLAVGGAPLRGVIWCHGQRRWMLF